MPYKSLAQEKYFNANRAKLEKQGVNVDEWNTASKGKSLPMKTKKPAPKYTSKPVRGKMEKAADKMLFSKRSK